MPLILYCHWSYKAAGPTMPWSCRRSYNATGLTCFHIVIDLTRLGSCHQSYSAKVLPLILQCHSYKATGPIMPWSCHRSYNATGLTCFYIIIGLTRPWSRHRSYNATGLFIGLKKLLDKNILWLDGQTKFWSHHTIGITTLWLCHQS